MNKMFVSFRLPLLLLTCMVFFFSCGKKNDTAAADINTPGATATVKYNNKHLSFKSPDSSNIAIYAKPAPDQEKRLSIYLIDYENDLAITLTIDPFSGKNGTFNLGKWIPGTNMSTGFLYLLGSDESSDKDVFSTYLIVSQQQEIKGSGSVVIKSFENGRVKGTFSMNVFNYDSENKTSESITITNGTFNVAL